MLSKTELEASIGMEINASTLLVTLHPATMDIVPVAERCQALLDALDSFVLSRIIFTYPNNDPEGEVIIRMINDYAARNPKRTVIVPSLGRHRYISALHYVSAVVGNSSSGIVEVPTMRIPTVDIGIRQQGRIAASSVIHCGGEAEEIHQAISFALSPAGKRLALETDNPYARRDTVRRIVDTLVTIRPEKLTAKRFVDPYPILNVPANMIQEQEDPHYL